MLTQPTVQTWGKAYLAVSGLWTALLHVDYSPAGLLAYTGLAVIAALLLVDAVNHEGLQGQAQPRPWTCRRRHFLLLGFAGVQMCLIYEAVLSFRADLEVLRYALDGLLAASLAVSDAKHRLRSMRDAESSCPSTDTAA